MLSSLEADPHAPFSFTHLLHRALAAPSPDLAPTQPPLIWHRSSSRVGPLDDFGYRWAIGSHDLPYWANRGDRDISYLPTNVSKLINHRSLMAGTHATLTNQKTFAYSTAVLIGEMTTSLFHGSLSILQN